MENDTNCMIDCETNVPSVLIEIHKIIIEKNADFAFAVSLVSH